MNTRMTAIATLLLAGLSLTSARTAPQSQPAGTLAASAPPAFSDPGRRAKLAGAFAGIDRLFQDFVTRGNIPGAAWGIVVDGELAHSGTMGLRDVASKAPVMPDTVFRIASMTKSFTAMAILKLRDEGKLSLDDPAERYVPELKGLRYPTADSPRITIRHLLSHAEGFPEDNAWADRHLADSREQFSRMLERGLPFSNAPGLAYEYSNYGFAILGRIVSGASGVPYNEFIEASLLRPLGMTSTTLEPRSVPRDRLALGYRWEDGRWVEEELLADGAFGAMGGMLTSVPDLAKYVGALLSAWPPRDGPEGGPVRRASLREMQQVARTQPALITRSGDTGAIELSAGGYGFGLRISQTCDFGLIVAHGGGLPGFGSIMRWLPEYGVGIIAFGNLTYTGWSGVTGTAFERLSATGGLQPRVVQPSPALVEARDAVSRLIARWDDTEIDRIAADNLFLDRSKERRRADLDALRSKVGLCKAAQAFDYLENALRGEWTLSCERGDVRASVTLAPTMPPRVQVMQARAVPANAPPRHRQACPEGR
ncbi:MAG TPA: serine hydrolase domain-containing protein [Vicinamibacterales bacterium]|nr:serine hydrolase domain-containing protein [Vicinamibacterales bacterium]